MSSARTNLRTAIKSCLLEITTSAGYYSSILHVFDPAINMEKMTEFPSVNILLGEERRLIERATSNNFLLDLLLPVQFDVFLSDRNDPVLAQDKVLADIQRYFGVNYYVKPSGDERRAFSCLYSGSIPWGTEVQSPNCGITVNFDFWYSIKINNPDAMV